MRAGQRSGAMLQVHVPVRVDDADGPFEIFLPYDPTAARWSARMHRMTGSFRGALRRERVA